MVINEKIRVMCNNLMFPEGKLTDEFLFTINAVDIRYFRNNIGEADIRTGFVDGKSDGGIDFIYNDENAMYLIQGKSSDSLSFEEIKNVFIKMNDTVNKFEMNKYSEFSSLLKSTYLNAFDDLNEDQNIELVLFTNTLISNDLRNRIQQFASESPFENYKIKVFDENDLDEMQAILFQESDLIPEDSIEIQLNDEGSNADLPNGEKGNILSYGKDGIIVNVKATSVKKLFEKYSKNGLFSYNLREHISQKNVDDAIDQTIKADRENFWYYNNGITIGCEDYSISGYKIKLYGFSIINGAQTTTKIGKSKIIDRDHDFSLSCKIVRDTSLDEDNNFIGKISEASNSQKPIKQRDLKSNAREQKILQSKCANNGDYSLAVEIKRGLKPKNYRRVEKWQRVTNEMLGQLIYACIYQHPSSAKKDKNKLFSATKIYNQVYKSNYDYNTIYDLVRLSYLYDEYLKDYVEKETDVDNIAVAKNGKLTCLAVAIYLRKKQLGILHDCSDTDGLQSNNIDGLLITDYDGDDLDEKVYGLFGFIVRELSQLYEVKKESLKVTSCTSFFKNHTIYEEVILHKFDTLDSYDEAKVESFMEVFSKKKTS